MTRRFLKGVFLLCLPLFFAEAQSPATATKSGWTQSSAGLIVEPVLNEISGLAASRCDSDRLWVLNDSGNEAALYAISKTGVFLGTLEIDGAKNSDWEDLASFSLEGKNYLLIGDMGDNLGRRKDCRLYLVEEPETLSAHGKVTPLAVIPFSYEDGPRDVEALSVDLPAGKILLLSKREKVTALYQLPLLLKSPSSPLVAKKVARMESLPQPTEEDRRNNPMMAPYLGQPTGMDLSADGSSLVVLTYQEVFVYRRKAGEDWAEAVKRAPETLPRHFLLQAEAVCFSVEGKIIFVSSERKIASPLLRYERRE